MSPFNKQKQRFGELEFKYFGGSDVANKLDKLEYSIRHLHSNHFRVCIDVLFLLISKMFNFINVHEDRQLMQSVLISNV